MKRLTKIQTCFLLGFLALLCITSCQKEKTNAAPVARAGPDQTISLPGNSALLDDDGSTDPDNNIASYAWSKIFGPGSFHISPTTKKPQAGVPDLVDGVYLFELKVINDGGLHYQLSLNLSS